MPPVFVMKTGGIDSPDCHFHSRWGWLSGTRCLPDVQCLHFAICTEQRKSFILSGETYPCKFFCRNSFCKSCDMRSEWILPATDPHTCSQGNRPQQESDNPYHQCSCRCDGAQSDTGLLRNICIESQPFQHFPRNIRAFLFLQFKVFCENVATEIVML